MVDVSGGIDQEVRSGIFYKDAQWSRHSVSIYLGFRASGLGDVLISWGQIGSDENETLAGGSTSLNGSIYAKNLDWGASLNNALVGFRASPESHSFFTFGTIY